MVEPVNVLQISLHPDGLAPTISNLAEWRHHVLERLRQQMEASGDQDLASLYAELLALAGPHQTRAATNGFAIPLRLQLADGQVLSLISATTVFGTATELTMSELMIESFFPADAATRAYYVDQASFAQP